MDRKVYIGSHGPHYYEDTDPINDPHGDFAGVNRHALATEGQLYVESQPILPENVVRLADIIGPMSLAWPIGTIVLTSTDINPSLLGMIGLWVSYS